MPPKLDEATQNDPKVRTTLIFFQYQSGKPIFECYKELCKRMGLNFMDYLEFEFWWMRFSAGNFDLSYDRSKAPKYRTITDMPVDIFERIFENLGGNYQREYWFKLRHTCTSFVVSSRPPKFEKIEIICKENSISLRFDHLSFSYSQKLENISEINFNDYGDNAYSTYQKGNYRDWAVDDLMSVLVSRGGYKLQNLLIPQDIDNRFAQKLSEKFKNVATNIHVDCVRLEWNEPVSVNNILNIFKTIKEIIILHAQGNHPITQEHIKPIIDGFNEIDALKNAGMVRINWTLTGSDSKFLFPRGLKIPKMTLTYRSLSDKKAFKIVRILLKLPHLKCCRINTSSFLKTVEFEENLKKLGAEKDAENPNVYKYQIPDSDEYFEIEIPKEADLPERLARILPQFVINISSFYIERK